jgi:general secretion pathway protein F
MATLVRGGLPLVTALNALVEQVENEQFVAVYADVRERINEGSSFADALAEHPRIFSPLYVSMVRAGEMSGALEVVLERLADFLEGQEELRGKVLSALIYPAIMLLIGSAVVIFMVTYVIPQVQVIFEETKQALPLPTRILLAGTDFIRHWGWLLAILLGLSYYIFTRYIKTEAGRLKWDRFRITAPIFGSMSLVVSISRFARTLSTLLTSGVPLVRSLDIVEHVMGNVHLAEAVRRARNAIAEGADLAGPLKVSRFFPPIVVHMVAVGEKTGELERMLSHVADAYDTEVELRIRAMTSMLEPALLVAMGVVVGFVVVSVLLPIFQMTQGF